MMVINKKLKIIFGFLISILIIIIVISGKIIIDGKNTSDIITQFKERGEYVETLVNPYSNKKIAYYIIRKEKTYEIEDNRRIYSNNNENINDVKYIGTTGDIYISSNNSLGTIYTEWASKKIKIGHCGMVFNADASKTIEITGNESKEENIVKECDNVWLENSYPDFTILRTKKQLNNEKLIEDIENKKGSKYNYLYFIKAKNKYYCTDLIKRILEESNDIKICDKEVLITGADMINSDELFIIYYKEKSNKNDVDYNVYYLSED